MKIVLPISVSINRAYGGGSGQRRFKSKEYKLWLALCPKLAHLELTDVNITYRFWFPDNRKRDCSNFIKAIDDYLVSQGVLIDDNWHVIESQHILPMGIDRKNPRVEITLE